MADLRTAMENENFTFIVDNLILFGKELASTKYENGERKDIYQWCIGEYWAEPDFSIHHIHSWENVKKWLNERKGYAYYNKKYKEEQQCNAIP